MPQFFPIYLFYLLYKAQMKDLAKKQMKLYSDWVDLFLI